MAKRDIFFGTGCTLLDLVVGGSRGRMGYPAGRFVNIVGDKSAGKSFLCTELIAAAYHSLPKKQFKWVYDDCEAGYSFNTMDMYGFDIMGDAEPSATVEEAFVNIANFAESLKGDQIGIYVLDSLDGLTSDEQDEQDEQAAARIKTVNAGKAYEKGTYGMGKPKYLSREFFPQLCSMIQDKNILVVIVSQVRENIDPFSFEKYKRNGGKAMDFYAHTVLWLASLKKIKKKDRPIGVVVKAKTTKSKTPRPFREGVFSILFDYGVDNIGSNLDYLYELRTPGGDLSPASKAVAWGGGEAPKPSLAKIKKWMKEFIVKAERAPNGKRVSAHDEFEKTGERATLENIFDFLDSYGNPVSLKTAYEKEFGGEGNIVLPREKMIKHIEENGLDGELAQMVAGKWEEIEGSISSQRKKRYATPPEV